MCCTSRSFHRKHTVLSNHLQIFSDLFTTSTTFCNLMVLHFLPPSTTLYNPCHPTMILKNLLQTCTTLQLCERGHKYPESDSMPTSTTLLPSPAQTTAYLYDSLQVLYQPPQLQHTFHNIQYNAL